MELKGDEMVEVEYKNVTKKYDAVRRCPDRGFECEKIAVEKIKHFISKEALNICLLYTSPSPRD